MFITSSLLSDGKSITKSKYIFLQFYYFTYLKQKYLQTSLLMTFTNTEPITSLFKKIDSDTGVFLWILRNFTFSYRIPLVAASVYKSFTWSRVIQTFIICEKLMMMLLFYYFFCLCLQRYVPWSSHTIKIKLPCYNDMQTQPPGVL